MVHRLRLVDRRSVEEDEGRGQGQRFLPVRYGPSQIHPLLPQSSGYSGENQSARDTVRPGLRIR